MLTWQYDEKTQCVLLSGVSQIQPVFIASHRKMNENRCPKRPERQMDQDITDQEKKGEGFYLFFSVKTIFAPGLNPSLF